MSAKKKTTKKTSKKESAEEKKRWSTKTRPRMGDRSKGGNRKNNPGGRPSRVEGQQCKPIGVSVTRDERDEFEFYAEKFANGNKSELFRRMFQVWKQNMITVVGDQYSEETG